MAKSRNKSSRRTVAEPPDRKPSEDGRTASGRQIDDAVATTRVSSAEEAGPPQETGESLQRMRLMAEIAGRVFRAMTSWLTHEQMHLRVLGWITWIFLLGLLGTVVLVSLFGGHLWLMLMTIGGLTGVVALTDVLRGIKRKSS